LWRHHYLGTQGVILVFSSRAKVIPENLVLEAINIFKDSNLSNVPFLILFDKSNYRMEEIGGDDIIVNIYEKLRFELTKGNFVYNVQFINFESRMGLDEIYLGLDWLSEYMPALKIIIFLIFLLIKFFKIYNNLKFIFFSKKLIKNRKFKFLLN